MRALPLPGVPVFQFAGKRLPYRCEPGGICQSRPSPSEPATGPCRMVGAEEPAGAENPGQGRHRPLHGGGFERFECPREMPEPLVFISEIDREQKPVVQAQAPHGLCPLEERQKPVARIVAAPGEAENGKMGEGCDRVGGKMPGPERDQARAELSAVNPARKEALVDIGL